LEALELTPAGGSMEATAPAGATDAAVQFFKQGFHLLSLLQRNLHICPKHFPSIVTDSVNINPV